MKLMLISKKIKQYLKKAFSFQHGKTCYVVISTIIFTQITGCHHVINIPITPANHLDVSQEQATSTEPPSFYVCDENSYPCQPTTDKWQAIRHNTTTNKMISKTKVHKERKHASPKKYRNCLVK